MKKLSFSIAMNLLTQGFKSGVKTVKDGFSSIQARIVTFAAAVSALDLSLSGLVQRFVDVTRETSRAMTVLKNTSGSVSNFASNLRFANDMAGKYGIYINDLITNFAKFTAAAQNSGLALSEQYKIFESLTRASTAFGLSADQTNGVFLAVTQMMGKGKVQAEELRGQLGERMPIAMQAMAKAAGTTIEGLDKLMKEGKLLSADVLPKFAEALNEMLPNVDTENLESSIGRLQTAFQKLTERIGLRDSIKKMVDSVTSGLNSLTRAIESAATYMYAAITGFFLNKMVNAFLKSYKAASVIAMSEARSIAKKSGQAFDEMAWKAQSAGATIKVMFRNLAATIKTTFISTIPTAIIAVMGTAIAYLVNAYRESQRIKNLFDDYKSGADNASNTTESAQLKALQGTYRSDERACKKDGAGKAEERK